MSISENNNIDFLHFGISHQGKIRKENQDAYGIFTNGNWAIYIVCDGMGGAKGGRIASSLCLEVIGKQLEEMHNPNIDDLLGVISKANSTINTCSRMDSSLQGMGTTLVLFAVLEGGNYSIHVGDSRLYCLKNNNLQILTRDHTYAQELIDSGTLSESSAKRSPISHLLTKAIGTEVAIEPELSLLEDITKDDILILSSDGLYAHLNRKRIEEITQETIKKNQNNSTQILIESLAKSLIDKTLEAGASDNTTVLVLKAGVRNKSDSKFYSYLSANSGINIDLNTLNIESMPQDLTSKAILHSALDASKQSTSNGSLGNSLLAYFLLGISVILGIALWGIIAHEEKVNQEALRTSAKLNKAIRDILEERKIASTHTQPALNNPMLLDPINAYGFTLEKYAELLNLPLKAPEISIADNRLHEDLALSPIEWKSDKDLIESIKANKLKNPNNKIPTSDQLGPNEKIEILNRKESLAESIWDIDFRINALEIGSKESEDNARKEIVAQKHLLEKDLTTVRQALKKLDEISQAEIANSNTNSVENLLKYAKTLSSKFKNLESIRQKYLAEKQNADFYAKLIKDSKDQLDLANKLAAANKKMQLIESQLREETKNSNEIHMESRLEHKATLNLLEDLLTKEDKRISRSLGFIGAYTTLNKESKISIWENLIQRRNELYSEHNLLEKSLPSEEDFKEQLLLRRSTH